jgi:cation diffusion facilitator CzcD-associated flavoprotein CzcO
MVPQRGTTWSSAPLASSTIPDTRIGPAFPISPGVQFHSARWNYDCDLAGKTVAVVDTGSSAAQIVPSIAADVDKLYLYQRQPGWVVPKGERIYNAREQAQLLQPGYRRLTWFRQYGNYERMLRSALVEGAPANTRAQGACLQHIAKVFADRPDLAKIVTPDYPFGGKRAVQDSNFYPALLRENVELIPHAVEKVTPTGIVDESGTERQVDVLVMCTGFTAPRFLATLDVIGRGGCTLREYWNGTPHALLGLMVPASRTSTCCTARTPMARRSCFSTSDKWSSSSQTLPVWSRGP